MEEEEDGGEVRATPRAPDNEQECHLVPTGADA